MRETIKAGSLEGTLALGKYEEGMRVICPKLSLRCSAERLRIPQAASRGPRIYGLE